MAEMQFDGTFSDLKLKVMSEAALQAIYPELVKLQDFAHTYSELEDRPGASIVIPTYDLSAAADFNEDTNNYGSGVNEIGAANVTLNKHLNKSISITDRDIADTGVQFVKDGAIAIAKTIGRGLNAYVFGMLNATNLPLSASFDVGTKAAPTSHKLYQIAAENGLDVGDSIVVLDPKNFADLLGTLDVYAYGGPEAMRYGYVPGLFGFKSVVCSTNLADGVNGVIINRNTVGIASRYLEPLAGAYPQTWKATDPDSGFTMGFRVFANLNTGRRYIAGEALVGASVFYNGNKAVRLINS